MAEVSATASADVSADLSGDAVYGAAISTAVQLAKETGTPAGEAVGNVAKAAVTGLAIGAAAGTVCGPFAPICSGVGAVVGALIALGIEIAKLFKDSGLDTEPCLVLDMGEMVSRRCHDGASTWTVGMNPFEKMLDRPLPAYPPGITPGFVLWYMRRIREDGLGVQWLNRLALAMKVDMPAFKKPAQLPTKAEAVRLGQQIRNGALANVLPAATPDVAFQMFALRGAGASIEQIYKILDVPIAASRIARMRRSEQLLDAAMNDRKLRVPLPPGPRLPDGIRPLKIEKRDEESSLPTFAKAGIGMTVLYLIFRAVK